MQHAGYLLSGADGQTFRVAFDKVEVLASPMEHLEAWIKFKQQRLAGTVKQVGHVQRA